jgi:hypothetical protein
MAKYTAMRAGLASVLFASALPAMAAARTATDAEYQGIRESLQAQSPGKGRVKLWDVKVGQGPDMSGKVQLVCGFANGARFYGTLSQNSQGKPYMMILGRGAIADAMCAEKLGV